MNTTIPKNYNIEIDRIHQSNSPPERRTIYHGKHGFKVHPYMVEARIKDSEGKIVATGKSYCAPVDQPVRKIGVNKALERVKREFFQQHPEVLA